MDSVFAIWSAVALAIGFWIFVGGLFISVGASIIVKEFKFWPAFRRLSKVVIYPLVVFIIVIISGV